MFVAELRAQRIDAHSAKICSKIGVRTCTSVPTKKKGTYSVNKSTFPFLFCKAGFYLQLFVFAEVLAFALVALALEPVALALVAFALEVLA